MQSSIKVAVITTLLSIATFAEVACWTFYGREAFPASSNRELEAILSSPVVLTDPALRLPIPTGILKDFPRVDAVAVGPLVRLDEAGKGYYVFRKIGETWRSSGGVNEFAPNGDPTWIVSVLGIRLASRLGIRLLNANTLIVPNAEWLNYEIEKLNVKLLKKNLEIIPFRFSSDLKLLRGDRKIEYPELYLRAFVEHKILPYSEIVHDTSFHSLSVLLTAAQLRPLWMRSQALLDFGDFVRSEVLKMPDEFRVLSNSKRREAFLNFLFQIASRFPDNLSGSIPSQILGYRQDGSNIDPLTQFRIVWFHLGGGLSGKDPDNPMVKFQTEYTLAHTVRGAIFKDVLPKLKIPMKDIKNQSVLSFRNSKKYQKQLFQLIENADVLTNELMDLYWLYESQNKSVLSQVIAKYNEFGEVVGGLAPFEHPLKAQLRRIQELNSVLDEKD